MFFVFVVLIIQFVNLFKRDYLKQLSANGFVTFDRWNFNHIKNWIL